MKAWLLVTALAIAVCNQAQAGPVVGPSINHRVKPGDTLELLAAEYYGDRRHAVFLLVANGLDHARALKPGETIHIPMNRTIPAETGDTLATLAKQHLGDERRATFLAEFNGLPNGASIAAGQSINVPLFVSHTAAGKEHISDIAAAYFGAKKHARMLAEYNFTTVTELSKGEQLIIPIIHVRVRESKLPPIDASSARRTKLRREMQGRAAAALPEAQAAWPKGDYTAIKRLLAPINTEYVDAQMAISVSILLGATYVAYDDNDSALATFRKAITRDPSHSLSVRAHSPKVRAVWTRAGGETHTK